MSNILLIGADGQLGSCLMQKKALLSNCTFTTTTLESLDISDEQAVNNIFKSNSFDYVVNCAAYTAVDKAESEEELVHQVNASALGLIGKAAKLGASKVIHVSTDYVFDGTNHLPYSEDMPTKPNSVYGQTKRDGEVLLLEHNPDSIIIRTSWLYSSFGNNFVKTMMRLGNERDSLGVIFDQVGTPTYAADLADVIIHIIKTDIDNSIPFQKGIYHYSNEGVASWYDFTKAIHRIAKINCNVKPIETKEYPTPAARPPYSLLNKAKIKNTYQLDVPYWLDSLEKCIDVILKES